MYPWFSLGQYGLHGIHDAPHARNIIVFEPEQRHDGVVAGDAKYRRLQVEEAVLRDDGRYLRPDTDVACRFVHDHEAAGLRHRGQNGLAVDRTQGREIDHFGADALRVELRRGAQRLLRHGAPGHDGDIVARAQHEAAVQGQRLSIVGHVLTHRAVQSDGFQEHYWIRIADRGQQQSVSAGRRGGAHHADSRNVTEQRFHAFRVMFGSVDPPTVRRTNHHQTEKTTTSPITHARHVIDDLVESRIEEAHELDLGHRFQAVRRHADGHARDHGLGERRVLDAVRAEPRLQARGRAEHAAIGADILTDHDDGVVMLHLPAMRHRDGLDHGYLRQFND